MTMNALDAIPTEVLFDIASYLDRTSLSKLAMSMKRGLHVANCISKPWPKTSPHNRLCQSCNIIFSPCDRFAVAEHDMKNNLHCVVYSIVNKNIGLVGEVLFNGKATSI